MSIRSPRQAARPSLIMLGVFAAALPASFAIACMSNGDASEEPTAGPRPQRNREADAGDAAATAHVPEIATPNETAGSRLEPRYSKLEGDDGSIFVQAATWWDSARNEICVVQTLSDGKQHCAPYGEEPVLGRDSFFQDAACTMAVLGFVTGRDTDSGTDCASPAPAPKRDVRVLPSAARDSCAPPRLASFPSGGRLALTTVYRRQSSGECTVAALDGRTSYEYFSALTPLEEVDPASFVAVTTAHDTSITPGRLRATREQWTFADGARASGWDAVLDSQRNELCSDQLADDGEHRCLPSAANIATVGFSDSGCSAPAVLVANEPGCSDDARSAHRRYMASFAYAGCRTARIYPWFESSPLPLHYTRPTSASACAATTHPADGSSGFFSFAGPLPLPIAPAAFAPIESIVEDSPPGFYARAGSRLVPRRLVHRADGMKTASPPRAFDTQLGAFCHPLTLQDGKAYCVGAFDYLSLSIDAAYYEDAACTSQVVGVTRAEPQTCGGPAIAPTRYLVDRPYLANGCRTHRLLEPASAALSIATLYQRASSGACSAVGASLSPSLFYRLADLKDVSPSTFVSITSSYGR